MSAPLRSGGAAEAAADAAVGVVRLRGVTVRYAGKVAVDGVDLTIERGELTALLGPSGCGKTSLLRAIAGFEVPAAGEVIVDGRTVSGPSCWVPPERRQVSMVFQEGALFPHLTVRGNVLYGLAGTTQRRGRDERARAALELVGMVELGERYPDELSGGQQQRVALARALAPEPRLVLLDEPFANLDSGLRERVREEVRAILRAAGATAVLVTHDQEEALSVADRVAVMVRGRVLQMAPPEEIYRRPASLEVARFLGDGQLVPCTVRDGVAESVFGRAPTAAADGPGLLLVRPEDLTVMPECFYDGQEGLAGEVVGRRFFGHDLVDEVRLADSGETLRVRSLAAPSHNPGERVWLVVRHRELPVFPSAEA